MSRNLIGKTVDDAARLWRLWHAKEPTDVTAHNYPLERYTPRLIGYADAIIYVSDKWEEDGDVYDYHHDFDSSPSVFFDDEEEGSEEADSADLLGVPEVSAKAQAALPILAGVRQLIIVREDGSKRDLRFRNMPMMCGTLDKKGIVILTNELGPIYIRGGQMHITARGIHR